MKLFKASNKAIRFACGNFHYSKSVPVNPCAYSVFNDKNEWCGVIIYSPGANPNLGKPYDLKTGQVIELARVALNGKQESTSKAVAISLKLIKKDLPLVKLVVSFADQNQGHFGTIYQATNWYFTGIGKSTPNYFYNGRWQHQRQIGSLGFKMSFANQNFIKKLQLNKFRYLFPIDKKMIDTCKTLSQPYPKKDISHADVAQGSASALQAGGDAQCNPSAQNFDIAAD